MLEPYLSASEASEDELARSKLQGILLDVRRLYRYRVANYSRQLAGICAGECAGRRAGT